MEHGFSGPGGVAQGDPVFTESTARAIALQRSGQKAWPRGRRLHRRAWSSTSTRLADRSPLTSRPAPDLPAPGMTAPLPSPPEHHIDYPNVTAGASLDHDRLFHAAAVGVGPGARGGAGAAGAPGGGPARPPPGEGAPPPPHPLPAPPPPPH